MERSCEDCKYYVVMPCWPSYCAFYVWDIDDPELRASICAKYTKEEKKEEGKMIVSCVNYTPKEDKQ